MATDLTSAGAGAPASGDPVGNTTNLCSAPPQKKIPIVFVPGVMGSRLHFSACNENWDPDHATRMVHWIFASAETKRTQLRWTTPAQVMTSYTDVAGDALIGAEAGGDRHGGHVVGGSLPRTRRRTATRGVAPWGSTSPFLRFPQGAAVQPQRGHAGVGRGVRLAAEQQGLGRLPHQAGQPHPRGGGRVAGHPGEPQHGRHGDALGHEGRAEEQGAGGRPHLPAGRRRRGHVPALLHGRDQGLRRGLGRHPPQHHHRQHGRQVRHRVERHARPDAAPPHQRLQGHGGKAPGSTTRWRGRSPRTPATCTTSTASRRARRGSSLRGSRPRPPPTSRPTSPPPRRSTPASSTGSTPRRRPSTAPASSTDMAVLFDPPTAAGAGHRHHRDPSTGTAARRPLHDHARRGRPAARSGRPWNSAEGDGTVPDTSGHALEPNSEVSGVEHSAACNDGKTRD